MRRYSLLLSMGLAVSVAGQSSSPTPAPPQPPSTTTAAPTAIPAPTPAPSESEAPACTTAPNPAVGLLTPIPENGGLPAIYSSLYETTETEIRHRATVRGYTMQIRQLRHKHFGDIRRDEIRKQGIELLKEFTDPAAFHPMIKELTREKDDVRLAMLDHFAGQGEHGQAALAWVVLYDTDTAIRNEAMRRMTSPVAEPVRYLVDRALRSTNMDTISAASVLVNAMNITQAIPLLIFAQVSVSQAAETSGDLAWIAIQTQHAYVAGLIPVAGDNAGAFQPIIGVVSDGAVLRVQDAVVIEYRPFVHQSLVNMTTLDSGQSTASLGYNIQAWWTWYNETYVPFKNGQLAQQQSQPAAPSGS